MTSQTTTVSREIKKKVHICRTCSNHDNVSPILKLSICLSVWPHGVQPTLLLCHGILQGRTLEWADIPFSRGSSRPRDWSRVSHTAGGFFTSWATREIVYLSMICLFIYLLSNLSIHLPFIYSFVYHPAIHLTAHPSIVSINHRFTLSIYLEFMYLYPSSIYLRSIHLSAIYVSVSIHPSNCPSIHCIYQTSSPHLLSIYLHYLHIYIYLYIFHSLIHHLVYQYIYLSHIYQCFYLPTYLYSFP